MNGTLKRKTHDASIAKFASASNDVPPPRLIMTPRFARGPTRAAEKVRSSVERLGNEASNVGEAIWQTMKEHAARWAESDRPLPTVDECRSKVGEIAKAVVSEHFRVNDEAWIFYAGEFHGMVSMRREALAKQRQST